MNTQSWKLAKADTPKKFDSLMRGDFAQLRFVTIGASPISECLWVKVKEFVFGSGDYWAVLDDEPEIIKDMPLDYQPMFKPCHVVDFITQDLDGIALVDLWGWSWGWYKQSDESNYPIQCSFGQIQDRGDFGVLGDGCFRGSKELRQFNRGISYKNNSKPQLKFDRACKSVCKKSGKILFVHYVVEATLKEKAAGLGITVHEYFPTLRVAQEEILGVIVRNGAASHER